MTAKRRGIRPALVNHLKGPIFAAAVIAACVACGQHDTPSQGNSDSAPASMSAAFESCPNPLEDWADGLPGLLLRTGYQTSATSGALLALGPDSLLICRVGYGIPNPTLRSSRHVGTAATRRLAAAIRSLPPGYSSGATSCPSGGDSTTLLDFRYPHMNDTILWWAASGCQTLTNGHVTANQAGNSGWDAFARLADGI